MSPNLASCAEISSALPTTTSTKSRSEKYFWATASAWALPDLADALEQPVVVIEAQPVKIEGEIGAGLGAKVLQRRRELAQDVIARALDLFLAEALFFRLGDELEGDVEHLADLVVLGVGGGVENAGAAPLLEAAVGVVGQAALDAQFGVEPRSEAPAEQRVHHLGGGADRRRPCRNRESRGRNRPGWRRACRSG